MFFHHPHHSHHPSVGGVIAHAAEHHFHRSRRRLTNRLLTAAILFGLGFLLGVYRHEAADWLRDGLCDRIPGHRRCGRR